MCKYIWENNPKQKWDTTTPYKTKTPTILKIHSRFEGGASNKANSRDKKMTGATNSHLIFQFPTTQYAHITYIQVKGN